MSLGEVDDLKNYKGLIVLVLLLAIILPSTVLAAPKVNDILKVIDNLSELKADLTAKFVMTQQKVGEGVKVYEGIYYRRDSDKSFLIVFTSPENQKGNGYLKQGDNMWFYMRNTRTFQHVNRDESIAGTDSKSGDFEDKKLLEMYKPIMDASGKEKIIEAKLGNYPVYQFEVIQKIEDVTYPKKVFWVRQDNLLPLKEQGYSLSGTLMQTTYYLSYTQLDGRYLNIKTMFVDEFEKGNKTLLDAKNISLQKIDDYVFTKAYLENLSK